MRVMVCLYVVTGLKKEQVAVTPISHASVLPSGELAKVSFSLRPTRAQGRSVRVPSGGQHTVCHTAPHPLCEACALPWCPRFR